ncbi:Hypothetical predicted protein [Octopus vulgaris]|uniref:Uncharacterized protein n=1 Tax=Octopus vulgaris TaxID=6645 RepID=A0AA36F9Q3_OCTVU|nr:Hypothetical predicted protein [Octopus vulgaris]
MLGRILNFDGVWDAGCICGRDDSDRTIVVVVIEDAFVFNYQLSSLDLALLIIGANNFSAAKLNIERLSFFNKGHWHRQSYLSMDCGDEQLRKDLRHVVKQYRESTYNNQSSSSQENPMATHATIHYVPQDQDDTIRYCLSLHTDSSQYFHIPTTLR